MMPEMGSRILGHPICILVIKPSYVGCQFVLHQPWEKIVGLRRCKSLIIWMELNLTLMESIKILVNTAHIKWQIRGFILSMQNAHKNFLSYGMTALKETWNSWRIYLYTSHVNRAPYKLICPFSNALESTCRLSLNVKKENCSNIDP